MTGQLWPLGLGQCLVVKHDDPNPNPTPQPPYPLFFFFFLSLRSVVTTQQRLTNSDQHSGLLHGLVVVVC